MSCPEPSPDPDRTPTLCEVFASTATDGAATGFLLAQLGSRQGSILWVQDRVSRREGGRPYATGMMELLSASHDLLHLQVARAVDVLWAMEEALGCPALAMVVGEVWGDPPALGFTATKRLAVRAESQGVTAWLFRRAGTPDLSAARERWRISSQPALPHPDDLRAPGEALWLAELFRSRQGRTGTWLARYDAAAERTALDASARRKAGRAGGGPDRTGTVLRLAFRPEGPGRLVMEPTFAPRPQAASSGSGAA